MASCGYRITDVQDSYSILMEVARPGTAPMAMIYDKENRLTLHQQGSTLTTFTYSGDGLKRSEADPAGTTTLIWDGTDYLQGRS